ncbi:carboxy-terminal processing protease [Liquorilactobacillus ghanensis DSM 18630]|uniref:Carboxy-terminal processing protease n=1 Tax=Liquorilactobacillus ghanensis DSM 18630 TaxID=1423750 RepID=A0A0R1VYV3_9LACO|nr:S41 family peptidase [Liquorilactobacillus ghanensis]KRM08243.1 carboxy-terminal processing protease [Liquorilactobacillus ghanensis DSM 18630]
MFKQKKTKSAKRFGWLAIIISSLTCFIVGGGIVFLFMNHQLQEAEATNQSLGKISTVYSALYNNYYKKVSRTKLVNGALTGMVNSLGDPFSEYMSKSETESLSNTISSSFTGIGAEVQKSGSHIEIISPIKGTPAEKAGLKARDIIEKINNKSINGYSLNKAVSLIRGKKGTNVTLTIKRGSETFTKTIKRDTIPVKTVNGKIVKGHPTVGYVQVSTFSENTAKEFKAELKNLQKKGAKSFIIDMRDNPGGLMDQALKMSSIFVKNNKVLLRVQQRTGAQQVYRAGKKFDGGYKIKGKTVVLINSGSASAAEIFSAALHQSAGDQLIGTKSYGKGTVQNTMPFNDQTELKMTIAKWLTPNGDWINHKGLQPTIKADYPSYAYQTAIDTKKTYQQGQVSGQIKKLQILLNALNYNSGQANGYFSDQTVAAVKKFQQANGLNATGQADAQTVNKLEEKIAAQISQHDDAYQTAIKALN